MSAYALPGLFPPIEATCQDSDGSSSTTRSHDVNTMIKADDFAGGWSSVFASNTGSSSSSSSSKNDDTNIIFQKRSSGVTTTTDGCCAYTEIPALKSCSSNSNGSLCSIENPSGRQAWPTLPLHHLFGSTRAATSTENVNAATSLSTQQQQQQEGQGDDPARTTPILNDSSDSFNVGISVTEAKIDPVRLVQYVAGSKTDRQYQHLRRRGASCGRTSTINNTCSFSNGGSAANNSQLLSSSPIDPMTTVSGGGSAGDSRGGVTTTNVSSATDEAIEFELSITFRGRKYTARRTMQCIVKLRDDLVREMRHRQRWLTITGAGSAPAAATTTTGAPSTSVQVQQDLKHYYHHQNHQEGASKLSMDVQIPEIPPFLTLERNGGPNQMHRGSNDAGFVGRGFTMLHAMVSSYVPVMERWLKNVMTIVPQDSECLLNFLWEPDQASAGSMGLGEGSITTTASSVAVPDLLKPITSLAAIGSLSAITEMDYCTSDDDDDDDDLNEE